MDYRILILFSLFLLCFTGIAGATTYYIDTDASGDYDCDGTNLQEEGW